MSSGNQLVSVLTAIVGEPNVIGDSSELAAFAIDGLTPKAVVAPGSAEEISKVLAYAVSEKLAVAPRGNGTKMAMGGAPRKLDLILSLLRMNRITEYDVPNLSLSVEAGMTLADVQKTLASSGKGSFLPLDPPYTDTATIGGIIATNSSGPRRYLYNTARDLLLGIKVVLPNGDIVAFGGKTVKNVSGYDMTKLMIGSFGALGVITEITTKLLPLPVASQTLLIAFADLVKAGSLARSVLHSVLLPSAMELMDDKAAAQLGEKARYLIAFSIEGVEEAVARQVAEISAMAKKGGSGDEKILMGEEDRRFWIRVRDFPLHSGSAAILKANVPISKLTDLLERCEKLTQAAGTECAFIGHAGNGILTCYVRDSGIAQGKLADLVSRFTALAAEANGNLVVEACPRDLKEKVSVWGQPRSDYGVMRRLKEAVDPAGILNPGRFVGGI